MILRVPGCLTLLVLGSILAAQEEVPYRLKVSARLEALQPAVSSETDQWEEGAEKVLVEGTPIRFRLERQDLSIAFRITPFPQNGRFLMIIQVDARRRSEEGRFVGLMSTVQTITMEPEVPVLFYPFGKSDQGRSLALELHVLSP